MTLNTPRLKVDIWSDPICPWCWVGKKRFEQGLEQFSEKEHVVQATHGYRIAAGHEPVSFVDVMRSRFESQREVDVVLERIQDAANSVGLEYRFSGMKMGDTSDAHALLAAANAIGLGERLSERFFIANMLEGRSLFDKQELIYLATEIGMDKDVSTTALVSKKLRGALLIDEGLANQYGGGGVPMFVLNEDAIINGAHPPEHFRQALALHWGAKNPTLVGSAPSCGPESCEI